MTDTDASEVVLRALHQVAPEAVLADVDPDETLRETLDLDSIDFLNFVVGIHELTGLDVPERDYAKLTTLHACVRYLCDAPGWARGGAG